MSAVSVRVLTAEEATGRLAELSAVLIDSVEGGASVGFLTPMTVSGGCWWRRTLRVRSAERFS
jgi:hypothetical protein